MSAPTHMKYPRTKHVPFSPGLTSDEKAIQTLDCFLGKDIVITEKMDGSNVCLTRDHVFARSHNGPPSHPSFDLLKAFHAQIRHRIPEGVDVFGEWLHAVHSIKYTSLADYLMVFAVRKGDEWSSWDDVSKMAVKLETSTVPVVITGKAPNRHDMELFIKLVGSNMSAYGDTCEGSVIRVAGAFKDADWDTSIAKFVRKDHVQTDVHWSDGKWAKNKVKE